MPVTQTHIDELDATMREKALVAFESLANAQRGEPEMMGGGGPMMANPALRNATGIYLTLTEHVGDITNRIAQRHHVRMCYGIDMAEPKVRMALRALRHRYGCAREIAEQIEAGRRYHYEQTGEDVPRQKWQADFEEACLRYKRAHEKLVVYNRAQHLAKQAAVAIGARDYAAATDYLTILETLMENDALWEKHAGIVYVDGDRIVPYDEAWATMKEQHNPMRALMNVVENIISISAPKTDPDSPVAKFMVDYEAETQEHPMLPPQTRVLVYSPDDFVMLKLDRHSDDPNGTINLGMIQTSERKVGSGSKALKWLCDLADKHGVTIKGTARAYSRQGMTTDPTALNHRNLVAWYARNGFEAARGNARDGQDIIRRPKG